MALAGCGSEADSAIDVAAGPGSGKPAYGDTYIEALQGNISGLIPNVLSDGPSFEVAGMIYNGLVKYDKDLNLVGELAESWQYSRDCLDLTFKLRRNVQWHDNQPFTAADVVFTYETMINPKTPTAYGGDFKAVESVEAVDPYTVRVRYKHPNAKALQSWSIWMLPKHLLESYAREGKLREAPQNRTEPVGTGPYRFKEWKAGEKVVLVANPNYFDGRPYHLAHRLPHHPELGDDLPGAEGQGRGRCQAHRAPVQAADRVSGLPQGLQQVSVRGERLRVPGHEPARRALRRPARAAGVRPRDQQARADRGRASRARARGDRPLQAGHVAVQPERPSVSVRLRRRRARSWPQAGWTDKNADGILVKNGVPFKFDLLSAQGSDEGRKVAEIIQASLKDIGVQVEIRVIEWAALLKEYIKKRNFETVILAWGITPDPDQYDIWHSSKTSPDELNRIGYANPEVDELLEKGRSTCVEADRKKYYDRLQEVLADDQPIVFLYFRDGLPVVSSRVRGIVPAPIGINYNFNEWFVPLNLHRYTAG